MALAFYREPLACPPPGPPTALLVFEHASETELVKSIHMYADGETYTVIQQEFRFSFDKYVRISEPLASMYCNSLSPGGWEQVLSTWKRLVISEDTSWQCILEFHVDLPQATPLIPLLSVSRNPALGHLPSLAYDLEFVEWELQKRAGLLDGWLELPPLSSSKQQCPGDLSLLGNFATCTVSGMLETEAGPPPEQQEPATFPGSIDDFHDWADLASQKQLPMLETSCNIGSSWTCGDISNLTMPVLESGLISIPSPSSSFSDHDTASNNCWSLPTIAPPSELPLDQDSLLGLSDSSEASRIGGSSASQNSDSARSNALPADRSHCSDESVVSLSGRNKHGNSNMNCSRYCTTRPSSRSTKQVGSGSGSQQRGPTERMMEISLNELSQYFHMPITQASKELKVGLTVLKKRCREFGIPRWPHRKLKSLDSLIHNIQELSKDSEGRKNFMDAVRELENQKKSMEESPGIELSERTKRLRQACFKQSYKQRRQALAQLEMERGGDKAG